MEKYKINKLNDLLGLNKESILDQTITRLTEPGENYGSLILKVDITYKTNGRIETFHGVAKCVPRNKAMQEIFNTKITFKNEIGWYTEVIPTIQEFQKKLNVEYVLDCFPKLFAARLSLYPESYFADADGVILLENLNVQGYKTRNRFDGFDLDTSQLILKKLAAFHGVLISIKLTKPEDFEQKIRPFITHTKNEPKNFSSSIISFLKSTNKYKTLMSRIEEAVKCKFNNIENAEEKWVSAIHNDFWVNNILFKDNNQIAFVDFQTCVYGSIVLDLIFFLAISVNIYVARTHFDNLLIFYYSEFIENLKQYNINTDIFKYTNFLNELKTQGKGSFARAIFTLLIVLGEESKKHDPENQNFDPDSFLEIMKKNLTERQKEKCHFLVEEFAKRNWI